MQRIEGMLLDELLDRVKEESQRKHLLAKMKANAWKTSIAKEMLLKQPTLLAYVTDKYGYRKGVVIATGSNQLSWSLVSKEDYRRTWVSIEQVPALARFIQRPDKYVAEGNEPLSAYEALNMLVSHPAFKSWSELGGYLNVPLFDRKTGIETAMDRLRLLDEMEKKDPSSTQFGFPIPNDPDLINALHYMSDRAARYFKAKK